MKCDHAELHNYGCYVKVCFVLIHVVFVLSKIFAEFGDSGIKVLNSLFNQYWL